MKIVFIGADDLLAEALIERMNKEGNDIYLLSDKELPRKSAGVLKRRFYRSSLKGTALLKILHSISPDSIVYAGSHYMNSCYQEEEEEDVALLARVLRIWSGFENVKFILLSSTEVYGNTIKKADEQCPYMPAGERGMRFVREEQLLELYCNQYHLNAVILRASQLYAGLAEEGGGDFLSMAYAQALGPAQQPFMNDIFQPLHVSDLADGIKRVLDYCRGHIYNVCGSFELSKKRLYELIRQKENIKGPPLIWERTRQAGISDNRRIKRELEWTDFHNLEELLQNGGIFYKKAKVKKKKKEKSGIPAGIRRLFENAAVFLIFFAMYWLCQSHSLFSQIDWLLIYVILISLFFGIRQSSIAVILSGIAYLYSQDLSIMEMTNFYSYAGSVLVIMEFVFLGLITSYTTDMLREELRNNRLELDMLGSEHEDLKVINEENVLIKNEYEERILDSKSGFPKLYHVVSRLMVQEPDRIFMEIMQIISDFIHTNTVAVYRVRKGSPYLRLINALNEPSVISGKSWNISEFPKIADALEHGELYQGEIGSGEPAVILPIMHQEACVAAIVVKTLPYESETLYHINLLKTLSLLLRDSVGRALEYEELSRSQQYMDGLDIQKPETFRSSVRLAQEKAQKDMAEFCIIKIIYSGSMEEAYQLVCAKLRTTDYFGLDEAGGLYVLLNNTGAGDIEYLKSRLEGSGVDIQMASAFMEGHQ